MTCFFCRLYLYVHSVRPFEDGFQKFQDVVKALSICVNLVYFILFYTAFKALETAPNERGQVPFTRESSAKCCFGPTSQGSGTLKCGWIFNIIASYDAPVHKLSYEPPYVVL